VDDLVEIEELQADLLLGTEEFSKLLVAGKYIVTASPLTMNDNALVIRDKLIRAFKALIRITPGGLLVEREFPVGHVCGCIYNIIEHLSLI